MRNENFKVKMNDSIAMVERILQQVDRITYVLSKLTETEFIARDLRIINGDIYLTFSLSRELSEQIKDLLLNTCPYASLSGVEMECNYRSLLNLLF